jgi:hypothetical protein
MVPVCEPLFENVCTCGTPVVKLFSGITAPPDCAMADCTISFADPPRRFATSRTSAGVFAGNVVGRLGGRIVVVPD